MLENLTDFIPTPLNSQNEADELYAIKKIYYTIPAEDVEYVESIRVYNVKIPDCYISRKELEKRMIDERKKIIEEMREWSEENKKGNVQEHRYIYSKHLSDFLNSLEKYNLRINKE